MSAQLPHAPARTYHSVDLIDSGGHVRRLEAHRRVGLQNLGEVEAVVEIVTTHVSLLRPIPYPFTTGVPSGSS